MIALSLKSRTFYALQVMHVTVSALGVCARVYASYAVKEISLQNAGDSLCKVKFQLTWMCLPIICG